MAPTTSTRVAAGIGHTHPSGARAPVPDERRWPSESPLTTRAALTRLEHDPIGLVGRLVDASNATFYCELGGGDEVEPTVHAVYKPIEGERPLDDFPDGTLAHREVGAWLVSEASGLGIVPPTVLRDGPFGPGMLQLWIEVDGQADPLTLVLTRDPRLRRISLLDLVLNNADRKGGHLLPTADGAILGVRSRHLLRERAEAADRALGLGRRAVRGRRAPGAARRSARPSTATSAIASARS